MKPLTITHVTPYTLTSPLDLSSLNALLQEHPGRPCTGSELQTIGWAPAINADGAPFALHSQGRILVRLEIHSRKLDGAAVKRELERRVKALEEKEQRKLRRKEKQELKEEVAGDLLAKLPQEFERIHFVSAIIEPDRGMILVGAGSSSAAETLLSALRDALGSLPVRPLNTQHSPATILTLWVNTEAGALPPTFELGDAAVLTGLEGATVRVKKQSLGCNEVQEAIRDRKQIREVDLAYSDRIHAKVTDALVLKGIALLEGVFDEIGETDEIEDPVQRAEADLTLLGAEIDAMLDALIDGCGGLHGEESQANAVKTPQAA